jgi:hypothetical protein
MSLRGDSTWEASTFSPRKVGYPFSDKGGIIHAVPFPVSAPPFSLMGFRQLENLTHS